MTWLHVTTHLKATAYLFGLHLMMATALHAQTCRSLSAVPDEVDGGASVPPTTAVVIAGDGHAYTAHPIQGVIGSYGPRGDVVDEIATEAMSWSGRPTRLGWLGDTLYAIDGNQASAALFEADLRLRETRPVAVPSFDGPHRASAPMQLAVDGRGIFVPNTNFRPGRRPGESPHGEGEDVPVVIAPLEGGNVDTVVRFVRRNSYMSYESLPGRTNFTAQPFRDDPVIGVAPDGSYLVVVDRRVRTGAVEHTYGVLRVSTAGDTLAKRRIGYEPVPLRDEWVDSAVASIVSRHVDGTVGADSLAGRIARSIRSVLHRPEALTPVTAVVVARDGGVWIRRESVPGADWIRWDILDPVGLRIGYVNVPASITIRAVSGDAVWATERTDERQYRLRVMELDECNPMTAETKDETHRHLRPRDLPARPRRQRLRRLARHRGLGKSPRRLR